MRDRDDRRRTRMISRREIPVLHFLGFPGRCHDVFSLVNPLSRPPLLLLSVVARAEGEL